MQILYIINDEFTKDSGVLKKVNNQIAYWSDQGVKTHLFIIGVNKFAKEDFIFTEKLHKLTYYKSPLASLFGGSLFRNLNRILCASPLLKIAKGSDIDLIYLREITYFPRLDKILEAKPSVLELNSIYLNEIAHLPATKKNIIESNQKKLFNTVSGFVCVTNEIAQLIKDYNKPWVCCSNGVMIKEHKQAPKDDTTTNLIMVCSPNMSWHGVDKLPILAKHFPQMQFHLVGPTVDAKLPNLIQYGLMPPEQLHELYSKMHIALGCFSLYKKGMNESCSLKVREYLMHGLPIIMGEHDVDVSGQDFVLEIGNYENNVQDNLKSIEQFIDKYHQKRISLQDIEHLISFEAKEKIRLTFFHRFVT